MGQYKSQHTGPQIDAGINAALNPDLVPTEGSDALITSDAVAKVQQGFAPIETAATSANSYAIGELLVWGGVLYKAKTSITAGDSFVVDTNIEATTVADKLNNIDTEITSDTDTTLTGLLTGNGSKVGTKSLDTSSLTNDADHVPVSSVVKSALDYVESNIGIVENGDNATQNISSGQYVIWKGSLYKANQAISSGAALSGKLTAVSNGGLNDLNIKTPWKNIVTFNIPSFSIAGGGGYSHTITSVPKDRTIYAGNVSIVGNGSGYATWQFGYDNVPESATYYAVIIRNLRADATYTWQAKVSLLTD